jgi:hypothetical protein
MTPDGESVVRTIERDPRLPASEIQRFFHNDEPMPFMRLPYDGYAILRGRINRDGSITVRVVSSYPDESRNDLARSLSEAVRLPPYTRDPRRRPVVHVYVVFYEHFTSPRKALVYATAETAYDSEARSGGYLHIGDY